MCGGRLLIAPCSRVGHVFRKTTPYSFPGGTSHIVDKNNGRLAEVFLDEWKSFYFAMFPGFFYFFRCYTIEKITLLILCSTNANFAEHDSLRSTEFHLNA